MLRISIWLWTYIECMYFNIDLDQVSSKAFLGCTFNIAVLNWTIKAIANWSRCCLFNVRFGMVRRHLNYGWFLIVANPVVVCPFSRPSKITVYREVEVGRLPRSNYWGQCSSTSLIGFTLQVWFWEKTSSKSRDNKCTAKT